MKKKLLVLTVGMAMVGLVLQPGCKTTEESQQYILTVTVGEGVTGSPVTGSYSYAQGDIVTYNYAAETGYENLVVQVDGATVANSGTITVNMNHTLTASAEPGFDVRGNWTGELRYGTQYYNLDFTFSGGINSGTVTGTLQTIGNGEGTYSITNNTIEFTIEWIDHPFTYWHEYTGQINTDTNMTGDWSSSLSYEEGIWNLVR